MMDALDAIMRVMEAAFDPAYGEAWNRSQVSNALIMPNSCHLLAGPDGGEPRRMEDVVGFTLSRGAADEEELLLIGVMPAARGQGVGARLMQRFIASVEARGRERIFLEMRAGNPAERLYLASGFTAVGRRPNYYRSGSAAPIDAITFARLRE